MTTIQLPAGIGDAIWVLQKLVHTKQKFHFQLPGGQPQRGKQVFDLLPQLTESCSYVEKLGYKHIKHVAKTKWEQVNGLAALSANEHLERGIRIEKYLPDLPTSYTLDYKTSQENKVVAQELVDNGRFIGIYGSSYSMERSWNGWKEDKWFEFIKLFPKGYTFVIIGAKWDIDLGGELIKLLEKENIPFVNTIGQPLGVVIEVLKRLEMFIGFPSGLSILNETLAKRTLMFYPPHLNKMINAWPDPERIRSGEYKGCQFCEPVKIFEWIKTNWL
jgi:ADP-heptose:LPS heptosyltransferase